MPKKMGVNSKAEEARARKTATEAKRKDLDARDKEDQYWREAEGSKSCAAKKREEEAEKRAEAAARKAEARRIAEQEKKEEEDDMFFLASTHKREAEAWKVFVKQQWKTQKIFPESPSQ
ncbi:unnamed protein product [Camellia sinensis]